MSFCEIYGADRESIKHTLIECTVARIFWQEMRSLSGAKLPRLHPHTWASNIMKPEFCFEHDHNVFCIGMYAMWLQRNKLRHGADRPPLRKLAQWSIDTAHDLCQLLTVSRQKGAIVIIKWNMPPVGWVKCNVDGAFEVLMQTRDRVQLG